MRRRVFFATCALALAAAACSRHHHGRLLHLHILHNGHVRFDDGQELDLVQFRSQVRRLMQENSRPNISVEPDKDTSYDSTAKVFSIFQEEGYGPHFGITGLDQQS
jgi:biopolymer transport protein ExbD